MQDPEIVESFVAECLELIDELEPDVIEFQKSYDLSESVDEEKLNTILRLFHSLKGSSSFLDFKNMTRVAHNAESLLILFREGKTRLNADHTELFCLACDFFRTVLSKIQESGSDEGLEAEAEEIIKKLSRECSEEDNEAPRDGDYPPGDASVSSDPEVVRPPDNVADDGFQLKITPELKENFIQESDDLLEELEHNLIEMQNSTDPKECLANAFRNIHSFKGNSGFFGYMEIERMSHKTETVLNCMKEGKISPDTENIGEILNVVDALRGAVASLSQGGLPTIESYDTMIKLLDRMIPDPQGNEEDLRIGEILVERGDATHEDVQSALEIQKKPLGEILVEKGSVAPEAVESALALQKKQESKKIIRRDIRVNLDKLDELNDLVGELVTAQAMVVHNPDLKGCELENFEKAAHHLEQISSELQDVAMSLRMVPVSSLFRKMTRLVHDVSRKAGKKVNLEMKGKETEMDKTVIELISDPLVHIIRNSVDHGIESPDERRRSGKEETGTIVLEAKHEGGEVWIKITDDGRGLDKDKILAKAFEKGLLQGDVTDMKDKEIFGLIFEPGFSTAEKVTDISGRGVGMDVVRKNIDQLKGNVDVESTEGQGTVIILRIPLTLAIIDGMLVKAGQARYLIPLQAIKEAFRPEMEEITVMPGGQEMVMVRKDLLPIVRLSDLFRIGNRNEKLSEGILIILDDRDKSLCLFVNEMLGQMETVIKGLPGYMGAVKGVAGCTILGDGEVSLILDVGGIVERTRH